MGKSVRVRKMSTGEFEKLSERKMNEVQPQIGAFGDMGNLVNLKVPSGGDSLSKQVDLEEKENIEQPIRKKKTRGTRGGKKLREKRELRELRERNRKLGKENYRHEAIDDVKKALKRVSGGVTDFQKIIQYSAEELVKIREKAGFPEAVLASEYNERSDVWIFPVDSKSDNNPVISRILDHNGCDQFFGKEPYLFRLKKINKPNAVQNVTPIITAKSESGKKSPDSDKENEPRKFPMRPPAKPQEHSKSPTFGHDLISNEALYAHPYGYSYGCHMIPPYMVPTYYNVMVPVSFFPSPPNLSPMTSPLPSINSNSP